MMSRPLPPSSDWAAQYLEDEQPETIEAEIQDGVYQEVATPTSTKRPMSASAVCFWSAGIAAVIGGLALEVPWVTLFCLAFAIVQGARGGWLRNAP